MLLPCYTGTIEAADGAWNMEAKDMWEFIAENLPILICGLIGTGLLVVETFIPGFGLPGISGIVLQVITVTLTWINHGPMAALGMTLIVLSVDAIAISLALHSATKGKLSKSKIILRDTENNAAGAKRPLPVFYASVPYSLPSGTASPVRVRFSPTLRRAWG